jgi:hypothetical protein
MTRTYVMLGKRETFEELCASDRGILGVAKRVQTVCEKFLSDPVGEQAKHRRAQRTGKVLSFIVSS